MKCPTCGNPDWDPVREMNERAGRRAAFEAVWGRSLCCPACRKRNSAKYDVYVDDAGETGPTVRVLCSHCGHRYEVDRYSRLYPISQPNPEGATP